MQVLAPASKVGRKLSLVLCVFVSLFLAQSNVLAQTRQKRIVLISDIDDTIAITQNVFGYRFLSRVNNFMFRKRAFAGMQPLYSALHRNGVEIIYVTGTPNTFSLIDQSLRFLRKNWFPLGQVFGRVYNRSDTSEDIENFKTLTIQKIMQDALKSDPDTEFILVGDNGQQDYYVHKRILADPDLAKHISGAYVHTAYLPKYGVSINGNQIGYPTAAELALRLFDQKLINRDQFIGVIKDINTSSKDLTFPFTTSGVTPGQIKWLESQIRSIEEPTLKQELTSVLSLENRQMFDQKYHDAFLVCLRLMAARGELTKANDPSILK